MPKVDLEGHELPALKGWRKDLSEHKVRAIYIEIMPENQADMEDRRMLPSLSWNPLVTNSIFARKMTSDPLEVSPDTKPLPNGSLALSPFKAKEYPENFATDALALAPS